MGKNWATTWSKSKKWVRSYQISQLVSDFCQLTNTKLKFFEATLFKFNPLSAKLTKWPNTLKQFVGNFSYKCSTFPVFISWQKLSGDLFEAIVMSCKLLYNSGIALKAYMSILSVMWTAKAKFQFFCWLSVYIIWIPISVLKLLLYILAVSWILIFIHEYTWILIFIQKLFGHFAKQWPKMNTQRARENWGSSFHLQDYHLFPDHY